MMKNLTTALIFTALAASPALAKNYGKQSRMSAAPVAHQTYAYGSAHDAYAAYAAAPGGYMGGPAMIEYGTYAGWDPDPGIRLQLRRDPPAVSW